MNKKTKTIIIVLIISLLSAACVEKYMSQNDTFYLIKLGEYISHNGIDLLDHFSWIPGLSYTYPHWLYSVFIYFIYNNFGFDGIYVSNIIIYITIILSIYYVNLKINKDKFLSLLISLISIPLLMYFINPRSQSISCLIFIWEVYFINELIKTGKKKYIVYLAIGSLLLANTHGTIWLMYFVLFMPFIVSQLIYLFITKKKKKFIFDYKIIVEKINNFKPLLIAFGISFLMGLLTPSKICYTYYLKILEGSSQSFIQEHSPLVIINTPFMLIVLFFLYFTKEKIKLHELFMLGGLVLLSLMGQRHIIFFNTIGMIYIGTILIREIKAKKDHTLTILYDKIFNNKIIITIFLLISLIIYGAKCLENSQIEYVDNTEYPVDAVKYIKENLDYNNIKLYNDYNDGSYLLFNDIKVFIDSRCDLYFREFNHQYDIFDDYASTKYDYKYEEIFDKYYIQYILLNNEDSLYYILKDNSKYELLYDDKNYSIYKRHS